jgi:tRNA U34 5-carboxymethylaminomethyl modifying enzyme MnmG/GidA
LSVPASASATPYDLIVIGGGSGGLASAREASKLGRKVALLVPLLSACNLSVFCVRPALPL